MGKYIRFVSIKERVPARIDGTEFEYVFEVGSLRGDAFVAEKRYVLDIQASGTLQAVWHVSSEQMARIAAALATPYVLELAREDRLAELSPFKLNTYSAPKSPPEETRVEPGTVQAVPAAGPAPTQSVLSFLSEDISEVRDQINALAKSLWGERILLLSQERPLLDMYKNAKSAEDFRARIQSLGIIVKDLNRAVLAKVAAVADPKGVGDFILLEKALSSIAPVGEVSAIGTTFKQINSLRQGYPTHGDNTDRFLQAHKHFGLSYPIADFSAAWEIILGRYFDAMKELRSLLTSAWSGN
jgi:hypothetical protein